MDDLTIEQRMEKERLRETARQRAVARAKADLAEQGIYDPLETNIIRDPIAKYDASMAYQQKLMALVVKYLQMPSGPRPIIQYD